MTEWNDVTDDELLAELGEAVTEGESVSERRREAALAAFTWRSVDEELAELLHDSALDPGAAVRSAESSPRALTFGRSGLTLELEVEGDAVLGQVVGEGAAAASGAAARVTLQRPDADEVIVDVATSGFFRIEDVGPGPARFVVEQAGWSLTTPWVTL